MQATFLVVTYLYLGGGERHTHFTENSQYIFCSKRKAMLKKSNVNGTQKLLLYKLLNGIPHHEVGTGDPVLRALLSGRIPLSNF